MLRPALPADQGVLPGRGTLAAQFFLVWLFNKVPWFYNYSASGQINAPERTILGMAVTGPNAEAWVKYLFCFAFVFVLAWVARNLTRGAMGRQWMAIRDMDIAAEIIGVNPLRAKLSAFAVSSFYVGISGALLFTVYLGAAEVGEAYGIQKSFLVLFMIIIGGLGSLFGSFAGAAFMVLLPVALKVLLVDTMGWDTALATHFQFVIVGALIMIFLIAEPHGLARLWALAKEKLRLWPFPIEWAGHRDTTGEEAPAAQQKEPRGQRGETRLTEPEPLGRTTPMKSLATGGSSLDTAGLAFADLMIPDLSYRTGPFAAGGIPFSDGYQDYFALLNARDGGIGGVPVRVVECETAYNTERGVECYEATRGDNPLVYQPLSTGITYQLIPRATADGIPLHTMGYGRTSAVNGEVFSHVFNYPANYWDAASVMINVLLDENGGSLEGKKITLLYHNSAYGREPIRTLETLAAQHGFTLNLLAVDSPGQEQGNQWLTIRRDRPDYVLFWGWGVMNQVAIQEAINIRYPLENFIGNWWAGADHDVASAGAAAAGYRALNMNRLGDMPVFAEIQHHVIDAGLAAGDGTNLGSVLYTRGCMPRCWPPRPSARRRKSMAWPTSRPR